MIKLKQISKNQKIIIVFIAILLIISVYIYQNMEKRKEFNIIEANLNENIDNCIQNNIQEKGDEEKKEEKIKIHIAGAVQNEGLIELNINSRLNDAIEKAGGLKEDAYLDPINLAYMLEDGAKIYIPSQNEKEVYQNQNKGEGIYTVEGIKMNEQFDANKLGNIDGENKNKNKSNNNYNTLRININTANQVELENLPGIGPTIAQKIISYRNENGKFNEIDEIKKVNGIGENKYNKIKDFIYVK